MNTDHSNANANTTPRAGFSDSLTPAESNYIQVMKKNVLDRESTAVGAAGAVVIAAANAVPELFPAYAWITPLVNGLVSAVSSLYLIFRARKGK